MRNAAPIQTDSVVFVYGSLKRGESNHRLLAEAEFLGRGRTEPLFALYCLGPWPAMIRTTESPTAVEGELYRIGDRLLEQLDHFEAVGELYERQSIKVANLDDGGTHMAWVYLYLPQVPAEVDPLSGRSTDWRRWPGAWWSSQ